MAKKGVNITNNNFFNFIRFNNNQTEELFIYSNFRNNEFVKKIIIGNNSSDIIGKPTTTTTSTSTTLTSTSSTTSTTTTTTVLNFFNETDKKASFSLSNTFRTHTVNYSINPIISKTENFNQFTLPFINTNLIQLSVFDPNTNLEVNDFNGYELVITFNGGLSVTTYRNEQQLKLFRGNSNIFIFWFLNVVSVRFRYSTLSTTTTTSTTIEPTTTTTSSSTSSTTFSSTSTTSSSTSTTTTTVSPTTSTTTSTSSSTTTTTSTLSGITIDLKYQNIINDNPICDYKLYDNSDNLIDSAILGSTQQKYTISNFTLPFKFKIGLSDTSLIIAQGNYNIKIYKTFIVNSNNLLLDQNVLVPYSNSILSDLSLLSDTRNITVIITQINAIAPTTTITSSTSTTTTSTTIIPTTTTTSTLLVTRITFEDLTSRNLNFVLIPGNYSITPGMSNFLDIPENIYTVTINGDITNTTLDLIDSNNNTVSSNTTTSGFTINTSNIRKLIVKLTPITSTTSSTSTTTTTTTVSDNFYFLFEIDNNGIDEIEMDINLDT